MRGARASTLRAAAGQRGALLIEVLVAILICAFGLLGFAGMQARATSSEFEGFQRSQALVLVEDMVSRMNANRANAANYVTAGLVGDGPLEDCTGLAGAPLDLCEWANLIRGSAERRGGAGVGAMIAARGCITRPATSTDRYTVSVAWQGILPTAGAASPCGAGDATFPTETLRRAAASTLCIALLRDAAVAPVVPRC
ncbi:MAG: type IV pilus modification protein PilV [Caldimonas sp.]